MKKTIFAIALGATALAAGAASAGNGYWIKHGKVCFFNKFGYVQCVHKNNFYKPYQHSNVIGGGASRGQTSCRCEAPRCCKAQVFLQLLSRPQRTVTIKRYFNERTYYAS